MLAANRPAQWPKNLLVLSAPAAAGSLLDPDLKPALLATLVAFVLASAAVYLVNDTADRHVDATNPRTADRPLARGDVGPRTAVATAGMLGVLALVVVKPLGAAGWGHLSFPRAGWTIAVDLPAGDRRLGARLDAIDRDVAAVGGRVYLAKDAAADPTTVAARHPRLDEWRAIADRLDPDHVVPSDMDRRLGLRRPDRPAGRSHHPGIDQPSTEHQTTDGGHRTA